MRRRIWGVGLLLLVAVGLGACPPVTSKTSVGTTVTATPDPQFTGMWKGKPAGNDQDNYFSFFPQTDGTVTALVLDPPSPKDSGGWGAFSLQTVTLGPYRFINARETINDGKPATGPMADNIIPLLYRFNGDGALVLYLIDEDAAKAAIKSGKLAGNIEEGQFGDVTITAAPGDLDAYMASPSGRALFVKPFAILRKVK